MSDPIHASLLFLVNTLFDLYLFVLVVRIILVYVRANYFDSITQFVVKITDPLVKPLRRIIPNFRNIEISSIVLALALDIVKFICIGMLTFGMPAIMGLLVLAVGDLLKLILQVFFYAIILQVILSWLQPQSLANRLLIQFNSPVMYPLQRIIPPLGGIDISPLIAIILIQLLLILIANPIIATGLGLAFY